MNNDDSKIVYIGVPLSSIEEKPVPDTADTFLIDTPSGPRKSKMGNIYDRVKTAYLGIISPMDAAPLTGAWHGKATVSGTYVNFKDATNASIVVTAADLDIVSGVQRNEVIIEVNSGVSIKVVYAKIGPQGVAGTTDILNISAMSGNYNYADATAARADVPVSYRKYGLQVSYKSANTWVTDQFIGSDLGGWTNIANWINKLDPIINLSAYKNNYSYANADAARADVPVKLRQQGLEIRYKLTSGAWVREQFIGVDVVAWLTLSNWRSTEIVDVVNVSNLTGEFNIPSLTDAINLLPVNFRRYGIELRFKSAGVYKSFQYSGGNNLTTDFENIGNWTETGAAGGVDEFLTEANQTWTL